MIANVSPSLGCSEHTLNTLRYADRVKELKKEKASVTSKEDHLSKMLMLPRQKQNAKRYNVGGKPKETREPREVRPRPKKMDFIASTGETELEEDTAKMVPNHNFNPGQTRKRAWE